MSKDQVVHIENHATTNAMSGREGEAILIFVLFSRGCALHSHTNHCRTKNLVHVHQFQFGRDFL